MPNNYTTAPVPSKKWPAGISYIIGNEAAERFSFYGMKGILVVFMTAHLLNSQGQADYMSEADAKVWFHLFTSAVYFTPLLGGLLSDIFLGKYRTIILLSLVNFISPSPATFSFSSFDAVPEKFDDLLYAD